MNTFRVIVITIWVIGALLSWVKIAIDWKTEVQPYLYEDDIIFTTRKVTEALVWPSFVIIGLRKAFLELKEEKVTEVNKTTE